MMQPMAVTCSTGQVQHAPGSVAVHDGVIDQVGAASGPFAGGKNKDGILHTGAIEGVTLLSDVAGVDVHAAQEADGLSGDQGSAGNHTAALADDDAAFYSGAHLKHPLQCGVDTLLCRAVISGDLPLAGA